MNEWPNDLDVSAVFIDREFETINFAEYSIYLKFGDQLLLSIMSNFIYSSDLIKEEISFPIKNTHLISSIGSKIIKAEVFAKKDLCLWFDDGSNLLINGSIREYECYSVNFNDREFYI